MKLLVILLVIIEIQFQKGFCSNETENGLIDYSKLFGPSPREFLNFTELCKYDGYECEEHKVTTKDGYILGMFRIPNGKNCTDSDSKLPILFMHGLYLTGDDCIIPGPKKAHCYIYADNCFDVWVPNVRGNRYSRHHISLDPDSDPEFWDFALEEHSWYDLPASIDYILEKTDKKQINFVGHAQGVTMLLLLTAYQHEYNNKIQTAFAMSPTAWLDHSTFVVVSIQEFLAPSLGKISDLGGNGEFLAHGRLTNKAAEVLCGLTKLSYPLCSVFIFAVLGYNKFQITSDVLPVVVGHIPGGTSIKNFGRWGQIKKNGFAKYDYGPLENLEKYGQIKPPEFDLSAVTTKWIFICGKNDNVGTIEDTKILISKLSNTQLCIIEDKYFAHLDFLYGKDMPNYITPKTLEGFTNGDYKC